MRIIKTQKDIDSLRSSNILSVTLLDQIESYFLQLRGELEDEIESEFCLGSHGYIAILEARDNIRDLSNVGLNRDAGGLLGSYSEYVELLDLARRSPGVQSRCAIRQRLSDDVLYTTPKL